MPNSSQLTSIATDFQTSLCQRDEASGMIVPVALF